jgi:hypothetical protein
MMQIVAKNAIDDVSVDNWLLWGNYAVELYSDIFRIMILRGPIVLGLWPCQQWARTAGDYVASFIFIIYT